MVAGEDRVAFHARMCGALEGEFRGFDPTGESFEAEGIVIARVEDGKTAERWASYDALGMLRQLGLSDGATE
ncbi:ester cyclase [Halogeometricum rufum]|uniref:ester cyclase n=1 Tax=Halogeometricum rufum TaxID=553469 RepID=UPI000B7DE373|nr:ester cyclase [Halogeometricum rufum]